MIFTAAFSFISILNMLLIYKGLHREALVLLAGTSFVIYPLLGPILYLDVVFVFYVIYSFQRLSFSRNEIMVLLALGITSFISSLCYLSAASILQPLRFFEVIVLLLIVSKVSIRATTTSTFFYVLLFLGITSIVLQIAQIFSYDVAFVIKPIKSFTIGGWLKDSAQMGPFYLILFLWVYNTSNFHDYGKNILMLLFAINVAISTNRTSMFILIIVLSIIIITKLSVKLLIASVVIVLLFIANVEILGAKMFNTYSAVSQGDFKFDTLTLRLNNWSKIYSYAIDNCNVFFGCGYKLIEDNALEIRGRGRGMFTFDNMFVRYFIENGLIGGLLKTFVYAALLAKANIRYLIPMILLAMTQEVTEDLILFIPTIFLLYKN
mgnify:FL=1